MDRMRRTLKALAPLLVLAAGTVAAAPAAQAAIFERFDYGGAPYSYSTTICGTELQIEGTVTGAVTIRTGKGERATAFFEHDNFRFSETWTAANGKSVTVTGHANLNEVKAVPLGDGLFRFTAVAAGQPFVLSDSKGNRLLRDRGVIRQTFVLDTLGDDIPGGILVETLEVTVNGPHPGFEAHCDTLVPALTDP